jgi:thiol-disulfide isomerase/thioredoxin
MKFAAVAFILIGLFVFTACSPAQQPAPSPSESDATPDAQGEEIEPIPQEPIEPVPVETSASGWQSASLVDVTTGESFTIEDLSDKPVFVEMFAVWCPNCLRQQNEMKTLHETAGAEIEFVAIGVDPNEDKQKIIDHVQANGFTSRYVVNPPEVTQALVQEFGPGIANAPSTPVILVCPGGGAELLPRGVKSAAELSEFVDAQCV